MPPMNPISVDLIREMGVDAADIGQRLRSVDFGPEDLRKVRSLNDIVTPQIPALAGGFFDFLAGLDEARALLADPQLLGTARRMKVEHLKAMVQGDISVAYAQERIRLGELYSRAGVDTRSFLGAFHHLMREIGFVVMKHFEKSPVEGFEAFMAFKKLAFFDLTLIVDVLIYERQRVIGLQVDAIRELSTPVLQVRDKVLLLPLIGVMDTERARQVTEGLLAAVRATRARSVVLDVTGLPVIDSKVANYLIQTVSAARLMGATVIVAGLSSEVSQSLVGLGIDLEKLSTVSNLQRGLEKADKALGYRMVEMSVA